MISVVIPTSNSARVLLPRCFDSLITAAVRGVVREVIVSDFRFQATAPWRSPTAAGRPISFAPRRAAAPS